MKILIMSDSHLMTGMKNVIENERADINIHLGDSQMTLNNKEMKCFKYIVRGNCDFEKYPLDQMFELDGKMCLMIHGNQVYNAHDLESLAHYAKDYKCQVLFYGHTHVPVYAEVEGVTIINPGSFGRSRSRYPESYMILEIENGSWRVSLKNARTRKLIRELKINE